MRFACSTHIEAPLETVWDLLVDLPGWVNWNTTVIRTAGTVEPGGKVGVETKANPGRMFNATVVEYVPHQQMVWSGGMPLGLFRGVRTFRIEPGDNGTTFEMEEVYGGLLAGAITRQIPDLQPSFDEFAECLKREAERMR